MNDVQRQEEGNGKSSATEPLPNGAVCAAILSVAIGSFVLGILAVIGDGSKAVANWLTFYLPTGPLSGVTSVAILVWLIAWAGLAKRWRTKTLAVAKINAAAFVLLALSLLLTFPPFVDMLLGK